MSRFAVRFAAPARNERGVALFAAIAGMVLLSTMIAALVILARNETMIAQLTKDEAQAAYAAEAGANWGRKLLLQRLSVDLPAAVSAAGRPAMKTALVSTYNSYNGGAQFIRDFAVPSSGPAFLSCSGGCAEPNYSAVGDIPDAFLTPAERRRMSRADRMGVAAAREAIAASGLQLTREDPTRLGVILEDTRDGTSWKLQS